MPAETAAPPAPPAADGSGGPAGGRAGGRATGEKVWTVKAILDSSTEFLRGKKCPTPRLDTEILLAHVLGLERIQLYVRFADRLTDPQRAAMRDLVRRRGTHEPVAYLVGYKEFFSRRFTVNPGALIPRPSTETLVVEALEVMKPLDEPRVLDLCTGSGNVAVCLVKGHRGAQVVATDISDDALVVAKQNVREHGCEDRVTLAGGDLYDAVPPGGGPFDVITANPPYVADDGYDHLPVTIREHEPLVSLMAGPDGMDHARRIVDGAMARLNPGGWLMMENAAPNTPEIEDYYTAAGFERVRTAVDGDGLPRTVLGRKPD